MADRAQSEVLGFAIVFGIVVAGVAMVTVTGFAGLEDTRQHEQVSNAGVAFEVLADNVDELVEGGVPSRSAEIRLTDAQLTAATTIRIQVTVSPVGDPNVSKTYEIEPRPIVYTARTGSAVIYESGAVIRVDRGGMVMLREPSLRLAADRTVLPILETRTDEVESIGGTRRVHVRAVRSESPVLVANSTPHVVTIELVSPRAAAWHQYFEGNPDLSCTMPAPDTVRCTLTTDRVYLSAVRTDLTFS